MKLKFPKTIRIGDVTYNVKTDKERSDAEFYTWSKNKKGKVMRGDILIGTHLLEIEPITVLASIIHELKEIIQMEQATRFQDPSEKENYQFHYHHKEHTDLCARLAGALSEFLK